MFNISGNILTNRRRKRGIALIEKNSQAQCKDEIRNLIDQNGLPKTEKQDIVNILINQFSSVYKQRNLSEPAKKAVPFTKEICKVSDNIFSQDEILKKTKRNR